MATTIRDFENAIKQKVSQNPRSHTDIGNIIRKHVWVDENEKGWKGVLGFKYGIIQAPLGPDISGPELVAAVANAGALGFLRSPDSEKPSYVKELIKEVRKRTKERFGLGIILSFPYTENLKASLEEKIAVVQTYGGDVPPEVVQQCHAAGARVVAQIGTLGGAAKAKDAGVDAIVVQGIEAGGHLVGQEGGISLLPMVADLLKGTNITLIYAGGIVEARQYLAALALGAHGVALGTRFVATEESYAHHKYKEKIVELARTEYTNVYGRNRWPNTPQRVLVTGVFSKALPPYETEVDQPIIGHTVIDGEPTDVHLFGGTVPNKTTTGQVDQMAMYAGQSVGLIKEILPAGEVIKKLVKEAQELILEISLLTHAHNAA